MQSIARATVLVVAGLVISGLSAAAADEPPAGERREQPQKTVTLDYGDVVRQRHPDQRVLVRFRGKRGQQVRLATPQGHEPRDSVFVLRTHRGSIEPNRAGYIRLRRTGWQQLAFMPTAESSSRQELRLTRLRVRDLPVDSAARSFARRRGVEVAFRVIVPVDALATVRRADGSGFPMRAVLPPTGPLLYKSPDDYFRPPLFLQAGLPLSDTLRPLGRGAARGG